MEHTRIVFSIEGLSFTFDKHQPHFFLNMSAQFPAYEMSFISGKNGCGKSTLFRILSGGLNKWEVVTGALTFPSNPLKKHPLNHHKGNMAADHVKMVPQNFDSMIADQFTFIENLKLANLPTYPTLAPLPLHKPIPEFIKRFGIDFTKPAYLLSGGQRQILAILMALQKRTEILLLDEPTAALDERNAAMVMEFLVEFLKMSKVTILVVCHDYAIIKQYARDFYYFLDAPHDEKGGQLAENAVLCKMPVHTPLYTQ